MIRQTLVFLAAMLVVACNGNPGNEARQDSDALPVVREQYMAKCHLSGSDITKEYPKVLVYRADQIAFMNKEQPVASFPVKNGRFDGTAMLDTTLVYELVFTVPNSGMAMVRAFVPTTAGVSFIGPDSMDSELVELVSDTPENEGLKSYEAITYGMMPQIASIYDEYGELSRKGALNSPEGLAVKRRLDGFQATLDSLNLAYVADHPSIGSLYQIYSTIRDTRDNPGKTQAWTNLYDNSFADLFPDHPYHAMILSLTGNHVGEPMRDFTLPDEKGVQRTLTDLTAGKLAVVDFWASWCGSCRIRSKALIPIYEKYAGDDFTVVGVALEYKNDAAWRKALARDGYPWTNLIAIDAPPSLKANHAKAFVLDRNGTILAINPTVEELDALLQEKLTAR